MTQKTTTDLCAREEGPGQDEGPVAIRAVDGSAACDEALRGRLVVHGSVQVVDVAVLRVAVVQVVLRHRGLRAVEQWRDFRV